LLKSRLVYSHCGIVGVPFDFVCSLLQRSLDPLYRALNAADRVREGVAMCGVKVVPSHAACVSRSSRMRQPLKQIETASSTVTDIQVIGCTVIPLPVQR
jgi:hypothetical protein